MFSIDTRSRIPIYEQLGQNIINLVASGALAPDDQLPSVRNLARDLGVNPNTVQKAYQELENKGLIYQAAGRGSFIASDQGLSFALIEQKLNALKVPLADAYNVGVPKQRVLVLLEKTYGEETKDD